MTTTGPPRTPVAPFPLPLTPYERFMWRNDRRDYPSVFSVHLAIEGEVDMPRLDEAVATAVARHPLLSAVVTGRGRGARWRPLDAPPARVDWTKDSRAPIVPIDLLSERGLRVVGSRGSGGIDLVFHFHHACCDGGAALEVLGDVLGAYAGATPRPLDPSALVSRSREPRGRGPLSLGAQFVRALAFRPVPIARDEQTVQLDPLALSALPELRLDEGRTIALRDRARTAGATLNDLLLAECFLAVREWNAARRDGHRVRLLMPTNRRTDAHAALPAANVLGFEPIDRRIDETTDADALLASVRTETAAIKARGRPSWLDDWMAVTNASPPLLEAMLALPVSLYTGIVSNLGAPERGWPHLERRERFVAANAAIVRRIGFAPPVRPRSPLSLGITTYAGELSITGKADPATIGRRGLERFLDLLRSRLGG